MKSLVPPNCMLSLRAIRSLPIHSLHIRNFLQSQLLLLLLFSGLAPTTTRHSREYKTTAQERRPTGLWAALCLFRDGAALGRSSWAQAAAARLDLRIDEDMYPLRRYTHTHIHTYIHLYTHTHTHIHTDTYTDTYTRRWQRGPLHNQKKPGKLGTEADKKISTTPGGALGCFLLAAMNALYL